MIAGVIISYSLPKIELKQSSSDEKDGKDDYLDFNDTKSKLTTQYINTLKNHFTSITNHLKSSVIGAQNNYYYLTEFANNLCDLSKEFLCWTNIMCPFFN